MNISIILGNLGSDPRVNSAVSAANFSVATTEKFKDKEGQIQERTTWHNVSCFGNLVKVCDHLRKGSKVAVEGSTRTRTYTDSNGQERSTTELVARSIKLLSSKQDAAQPAPAPAPAASQPTSDDDEIPF